MTLHPAPTLTVDLSAVRANYRLLRKRFTGRECAAVVKADAYGLGCAAVVQALHAEGCRRFFVATLDEGIALRASLTSPSLTSSSPLRGDSVDITVFHGPYPGEEGEYLAHGLTPVLNSPEQLKRWNEKGGAPAMLHTDTGMCRLGFSAAELEEAGGELQHVTMLMSHLACANEPEHPKNAEQLARLQHARDRLGELPVSFCNSSGIFLDSGFHFDLARPGCALYGIQPTESGNPMLPVAVLSAPAMQIRTLDRHETIGYGASVALLEGARVAIVQLGYADGYTRRMSNRGHAWIAGQAVPVMGRVSMDMIALDVSAVPEAALPRARAEFLNAEYTVNDLARDAHTIGYEVLTRIGARVRREYIGGGI